MTFDGPMSTRMIRWAWLFNPSRGLEFRSKNENYLWDVSGLDFHGISYSLPGSGLWVGIFNFDVMSELDQCQLKLATFMQQVSGEAQLF